MSVDKLPVVKNKKKIDIRKFEALAKRVKKYFEEEEYLRRKRDEDRSKGLFCQQV